MITYSIPSFAIVSQNNQNKLAETCTIFSIEEIEILHFDTEEKRTNYIQTNNIIIQEETIPEPIQ